MDKKVLVTTLGQDPHTQGIVRFCNIATQAGYDVIFPPPDSSLGKIIETIKKEDPSHIGFSYRKSPEKGLILFNEVVKALTNANLLYRHQGEKRKIAFAGLHETAELVKKRAETIGITVTLFVQGDPLEQANQALDFLDLAKESKLKIHQELKTSFTPYRIKLLDDLATEVIQGDYAVEAPLEIPVEEARKSLVKRRQESSLDVLLRTHFGIPGKSIQPTVDGIHKIAKAKAIDEISIGSSDGSQRAFGKKELWNDVTFDGGVPYKTFDDLVDLVQAAKTGNFPAIKTYSHVADMVDFVNTSLKAGLLVGAHQAVPIYFFNQLDGRSPTPILESIQEHFNTISELNKHGIPIEINDPNHWSSRYAADSTYVASHGIAFAVILTLGVKNYIPQLQFNKPRETGDFNDLAKMLAVIDIINEMKTEEKESPKIWLETRAGIDSFEPDETKGKHQLARSTLLQMLMNPFMIHIVNYSEAYRIADADIIIESSQITKRAIRVFIKNKEALQKILDDPELIERRKYLVSEAKNILQAIASLSNEDEDDSLKNIAEHIAQPEILYEALELGLMAAPGIVLPKYGNNIVTGITKGGVEILDETGLPMGQKERIARILR
jgi:hypothetical protein